MRILMLAQNYAPVVGGEERMVEDLSIELVRRGHEVAVATIRRSEEEYTSDGVRIHGLRSISYRARRLYGGLERPQAPPLPDPQTVHDLRRVLQRERPDVVHAHNWLVHSYLPLERDSDAALVVSLHDYGLVCATKRLRHGGSECSGAEPLKCVRCAARYYQGAKGVVIALGALTRGHALRQRVDLFMPVSEAVRERCGLASGPRCRIVPNFIRMAGGSRRLDAAMHERLPRDPFLLFLGDVSADKGARHLADVYKTLDRPPPLVMIGRCFLEELSRDPAVMTLGPWPYEAAQEALRRCLFAIVPSVCAEAFGLAALETSAAGRAVIASAVGGLSEVVIDEETGLLVAPGDRNALRVALDRLIADARLRMRLGDAGARHARSFSAEAVVPLFEDGYRVAMKTRAARRCEPWSREARRPGQ